MRAIIFAGPMANVAFAAFIFMQLAGAEEPMDGTMPDSTKATGLGTTAT